VAAHLFKTEPTTYSWHDLARDGKTTWDGVKNAAALIHLRAVKRGDTVLIYHSGADKAVMGVAIATSAPYADPKLGDPKRTVIDLAPSKALAHPVPLASFRADTLLKSTELVRFTRLSIMPITNAQLNRVLALAKKSGA
jgi:predicted RNA-binding protein with PUA-like domain